MAVKDIEAEKSRLVSELEVEEFEVFSREEVPVKWCTFSDPWGKSNENKKMDDK